jgi:hypothetical protein
MLSPARVVPDVFDVVIAPHLGPEEMHKNVAAVDQNPVALGQAFDPDLANADFLERGAQIIGQRGQLARRAARFGRSLLPLGAIFFCDAAARRPGFLVFGDFRCAGLAFVAGFFLLIATCHDPFCLRLRRRSCVPDSGLSRLSSTSHAGGGMRANRPAALVFCLARAKRCAASPASPFVA